MLTPPVGTEGGTQLKNEFLYGKQMMTKNKTKNIVNVVQCTKEVVFSEDLTFGLVGLVALVGLTNV